MKIPELEYSFAAGLYEADIIPLIHLKPYFEELRDMTNIEADEKISNLTSSRSTILGFDIYRYSMFEDDPQIFIPMLFEKLYSETWSLVKQNFSYIFQKYDNYTMHDKSIEQPQFINTGDGGFLIIDSPIHAVLFLVVFSTLLRLYNSGLFLGKLHQDTGNIEIRYAITLDNVYKYKDNYYGKGIINCARILSKDKLNRFLIDDNVYTWFLSRMAGIENLMTSDLVTISGFDEFDGYDKLKIENENNALIYKDNELIRREGFKSIDVLKIGNIIEKNTELSIYNIHIQAIIDYRSFFSERRVFTVSIGNLNINGIS